MALAPISYGPDVAPDDQGVNAMREAVAQHQAVFKEVGAIGQNIEGGATAVTQGMLHTQALKATAAVKERQASTLQFIDSNPYVPKAVLQQRMRPEDYAAWHAGLATEYQDADKVPMFTAAGALFDSEAQQARGAAGQIISLPGWRTQWNATEQTESATIRERYVNRIAADQMIADHRGQDLLSIDKMRESAVTPADFDAAAKFAETSSWLKPAERKYKMEQAMADKDQFAAENFMRSHDVEGMENELVKLRADNAADLYPNLTSKQRLDLSSRLEREYNFYGAKSVADKVIVGPNVDENGKVNSVAIRKALANYGGPNKPAVEQAVKVQEAEALDIFNKGQTDLQHQLYTAGQDPHTGQFSMDRAQRTAEMRDIANKLNKDSPGLLTALANQDQHRLRIDEMSDREQREQARRDEIDASQHNLRQVYSVLDDPASAPRYAKMTLQQFDSELLDINPPLQRADFNAAETHFKEFQARGGKPDERPQRIVGAELMSAAGGDVNKMKKLGAKYGRDLLEQTHQFIRDNAALPPDQLTDAARKFVRDHMLTGTVVGSGSMITWDSRTRLIDWQTNPEYAGKDLRLEDGTIIGHDKQLVKMSNGKETRMVQAGDVAAARADGWE